MSRRITLICSIRAPSNENRILQNLHFILNQTVQVQIVECAFTGVGICGVLAGVIRQVWSAARSDIVIIHSPFALTFPAALTAWILRKQIIAFVWDSYPTLIAGRYYDRRLFRRIVDLTEVFVPKLVSRIVIPTNDFRIDPKYKNAEVIPFWTATDYKKNTSSRIQVSSKRRKIAFTGQINETRGVLHALIHLDQILKDCADVHLFSRDTVTCLSTVRFKKISVHHRGFLPHSEMLEHFREVDFGLVALHPQLGVPGFPSKTLDYLSLSLPVIYFGRSLPAYTAILEDSGAGFDVSNLNMLDLENLAELAPHMAKARYKFEAMICAKAGAFDHLFGEVS